MGPERHRIKSGAGRQDASLEEEVLVRLLRQHVGRFCDGAQRRQPGRNLLLRSLPQLLLLLLDLLEPGEGRKATWK